MLYKIFNSLIYYKLYYSNYLIFTFFISSKNSGTDNTYKSGTTSGGCKYFVMYDSDKILGTYCFPKTSWVTNIGSAFKNNFSLLTNQFDAFDKIKTFIDDVIEAWVPIVVCSLLAFVVGILYCYFLRCCAGVIAWLCILGVLGVTGFYGYIFYDGYEKKRKEISEAKALASSIDTSSMETDRNWDCFFFIVFWTFAFIWFCVILCCYHKISLIIHIIKASSRFINNNILVIFVPIFQVVIGIVIFIIWCVILVFVYTIGTIKRNSSGYPWSVVEQNTFGTTLFYFNCFAILWLVAYITMMQIFLIAAAGCVWYFQHGTAKGMKKSNPLWKALCWSVTNHSGSIAFGSFLLAVIWAIQIIIEYMYQKYKETKTENKFIEFCFKILRCIVACFERCIRFISKMAFIQMALTGKNFCTSAFKAFMLILLHASKFMILEIMGTFFAFMGIVIIAAGPVAICWLWFDNSDDYKPETSWDVI